QQFGATFGKVKIALLMFADDIVLIANSKKELREMMKYTYEYSLRWKFNFNYDKCGVITFEEKQLRKIKRGDCKNGICTCDKHWKLGENLIDEVLHYKYLGVEFSKNLSTKEFKRRIANKARQSMVMVCGMGVSSGYLSIKAGINLFIALVNSI